MDFCRIIKLYHQSVWNQKNVQDINPNLIGVTYTHFIYRNTWRQQIYLHYCKNTFSMIFRSLNGKIFAKKYVYMAKQNMFSKCLIRLLGNQKKMHLCVSHARNLYKSQNTLKFCFSCFRPGSEVISQHVIRQAPIRTIEDHCHPPMSDPLGRSWYKSILWLTHTFSILWLTYKYGQTFCYLHIHCLFCHLHALLEYGKAGAVAKNLIFDLCTIDPVRA